MVKQSDRPTLGQLRRAQGVTQRQVGDSIGVTDKAVSDWERGVFEPRLTPMQTLKVMNLYGCKTIEELVAAVAASIQARDEKLKANDKKR